MEHDHTTQLETRIRKQRFKQLRSCIYTEKKINARYPYTNVSRSYFISFSVIGERRDEMATQTCSKNIFEGVMDDAKPLC